MTKTAQAAAAAAAAPPPFEGVPPEALGFYAEVAAHQDKVWFEAHRGDYMDHVIGPAKSFIEAMGTRLQAMRPGIAYDTNHTGRGSFKKIFTDQRFRPDRDPFKTYCSIIFWEGPLKAKKDNSCLLVHFDPERVILAAGLKHWDSPLQRSYRDAVVHPRKGAALRRAVDSVKAAGYGVGSTHFKRTPRGYDPDHKNAPLLLHDSLHAHTTLAPVPTAIHTADFVELCAGHFEAMMPVHEWCVDLLGKG